MSMRPDGEEPILADRLTPVDQFNWENRGKSRLAVCYANCHLATRYNSGEKLTLIGSHQDDEKYTVTRETESKKAYGLHITVASMDTCGAELQFTDTNGMSENTILHEVRGDPDVRFSPASFDAVRGYPRAVETLPRTSFPAVTHLSGLELWYRSI